MLHSKSHVGNHLERPMLMKKKSAVSKQRTKVSNVVDYTEHSKYWSQALSTAAQDGDAKEIGVEQAVDTDAERGRQQQFARPLRDIRVGESPSRPWGITVPARYLEKVAGNARITAQVLEEVQARQDATKTRVDIRSVMHSIFNACFAIV